MPQCALKRRETPLKSLDARLTIALQSNFRTPINDIFSNVLHTCVTDEFITFSVPWVAWCIDPSIGCLLVLLSGLCELINAAIKWTVQRPRPFWEHSEIACVGKKWEQDYSFPSSHSQVIGAIFGFAFVNFDSVLLRCLFAIVAVFTGCSRVYRGVHYPACVCCGWTMGLLMAVGFHLWDPVHWFTSLAPMYQWAIFVLSATVPTLVLATIRYVVPAPQSALVAAWQQQARRNSVATSSNANLLLEPRRLSRYTLCLASIPGGVLGSILSLRGLEAFSFRFIAETCAFAPLDRLLLGYIGIFAIGFVGFTLPPRFKSEYVAEVIRCVSFFAVGVWVTFGCPYAAYQLLGQECSILPPIDASAGQVARSSIDSCRSTASNNSPLQNAALVIDTVASLQEVIAMANSENFKIRVLGASHSPQLYLENMLPWASLEPVKGTAGATHPIRLGSVFGQLELRPHDSVPSCMNHLPEGSIVAVAGAAIFLGKNPVVAEDQTLCPQLWDAGYSLSNVPGILALSLGGVLSMGADGDAARYSIFDNVLGFRFVDGNGSRHTVWRNDTDTDLF